MDSFAGISTARLYETVSAVGESLLSRIVPAVHAGACVPENGLICACLYDSGTACYQFFNPPQWHYSILECDGSCPYGDIHHCKPTCSPQV